MRIQGEPVLDGLNVFSFLRVCDQAITMNVRSRCSSIRRLALCVSVRHRFIYCYAFTEEFGFQKTSDPNFEFKHEQRSINLQMSGDNRKNIFLRETYRLSYDETRGVHGLFQAVDKKDW